MAEYMKNIAEKDRWDRWEKMHARNDVVFDRIISKLEILLQHYNCSPSSSHGVTNSSNSTPIQPIHSHLNSPKAASFHEIDKCLAKSSHEIKPSCTRIMDLLQKEIVASKSVNETLLVSDAIVPSMAPIVNHVVTKDTALPSSDAFLPFFEPILEPESVWETKMVETVTPTCDVDDDVGKLAITGSFSEIHGTTTKRECGFTQIDLECTTEPIHLISSQETQDRKTILEWICITKPPCLGMMWTGSIQKCLSRVRRNVSMQSMSTKPPEQNHHTVTSPLPPPEPPDMSYDTVVVMLTIAKHNLLCRPPANSHFWSFNKHGSIQHHVTWAWSQRIGLIALVGVVIIHQMIAKVLKFGTYIITFGENSVWTAYMLVILHDIEKNNMQHNSLSAGLCLMECINSLLEKHEIIGGLSLGLVLISCYEFNCVIGSQFFVLNATHGSVIHACRLFERYSDRDTVIWSSLVKSGVSFCSAKFASYLFLVMVFVGLKIGNYTFFVFCLSDIHFSNYHVCHDVELVSTVAFSHAKGSLQIPNESLDTKMRHQATQLCSNDEPRPIILTGNCSLTLCCCLRLRQYTNDTMDLQCYQVSINGLEEENSKLITIVADYSEALILQSIRVQYFVRNYLNPNFLDKDAGFDIFIGSLEGHCVTALVPWQWFIPSAISHEYWEYWKNFYNLEDKVCLHRVDSDMIHVVWVPCVLAWMIDNEGTINDIKAVKIMEKIKHTKFGREISKI